MKYVKEFPYRGKQRKSYWIGKPSKADKSIPQGGEYLLSKDKWGELESIQGCDPDVLYSPVMIKAFNGIVSSHTMGRKIALFGLCTATRPYSMSRKWKQYITDFEEYADLIICSNGGIIPIEFESQYPYLNYDAHGQSKYDKIYIEKGIERLKLFLQTHNYEYCLFNFRHNMRNYKIVETVGFWAKQKGYIRDYRIMPTKQQYEQSRKEGFVEKGFKMYPELWPTMYNPVLEQLQEWTNA
jgi:hypothetical protein